MDLLESLGDSRSRKPCIMLAAWVYDPG